MRRDGYHSASSRHSQSNKKPASIGMIILFIFLLVAVGYARLYDDFKSKPVASKITHVSKTRN